MSHDELLEYFTARKIAVSEPFDRVFLWVTKNDFDEIREHFIPEYNVLHSGKSFRSKSLWKHLHAVEQTEAVLIHIDTGNIARFIPLGLVHLVLDVIPYVYFSLRYRVSIDQIFKKPD